MPNYLNRDELVVDENVKGGAMEILNMYGADKVVPKEKEILEDDNDLLGGKLSEIMTSKKPHRDMVRRILQMKPKDIHIIKKSARYYLDNKHELKNDIEDGMLDDLGQTQHSNDLAEMIENDFEETNGGELDGTSLLEGFARLLDSIPKIQKQLN
tara:strand:- start:5556 stop:6020 length:465 start_codon:yes stop_codon:yes gene_type:complete